MSVYYKKIQRIVMKEYNYLSFENRLAFYALQLFQVVLIIVLFNYLQNLGVYQYNSSKINIEVLFLIGTIVAICCYSWYENKKHEINKQAAVQKYVENENINFESINILIDEIEKYNEKKRRFATWVAGLSATFIVLYSTVASNSYLKLFDLYTKVASNDEVIRLFGEVNPIASMDTFVSNTFSLGFQTLIIFIVLMLIIYSVVSIPTFFSKQVLVFLYDVKYILLSRGI